MTAERAERSLEERVEDLEAIVGTLVDAVRLHEPPDPSRENHRAFVARVRERERQA